MTLPFILTHSDFILLVTFPGNFYWKNSLKFKGKHFSFSSLNKEVWGRLYNYGHEIDSINKGKVSFKFEVLEVFLVVIFKTGDIEKWYWEVSFLRLSKLIFTGNHYFTGYNKRLTKGTYYYLTRCLNILKETLGDVPDVFQFKCLSRVIRSELPLTMKSLFFFSRLGPPSFP